MLKLNATARPIFPSSNSEEAITSTKSFFSMQLCRYDTNCVLIAFSNTFIFSTFSISVAFCCAGTWFRCIVGKPSGIVFRQRIGSSNRFSFLSSNQGSMWCLYPHSLYLRIGTYVVIVCLYSYSVIHKYPSSYIRFRDRWVRQEFRVIWPCNYKCVCALVAIQSAQMRFQVKPPVVHIAQINCSR